MPPGAYRRSILRGLLKKPLCVADKILYASRALITLYLYQVYLLHEPFLLLLNGEDRQIGGPQLFRRTRCTKAHPIWNSLHHAEHTGLFTALEYKIGFKTGG